MIAGQHFPSLFDGDNFTSRRTTGHNWLDPESVITGKEVYAGFTANNSARNWANERHYHLAASGILTVDEIVRTAPRRLHADLTGLNSSCFALDRLYESTHV